MRYFSILLIAAATAFCQPQGSSQVSKNIELGKTISPTLEQRDGKLDDAPLNDYVRSVMSRIATAAARTPPEIRITRGDKEYAQLLPTGVLYLSTAMLQRIESEAELAGLFAHQLAHGNGLMTRSNLVTFPVPACLLAAPPPVLNHGNRTVENDATGTATEYLKRAGYEPLGNPRTFIEVIPRSSGVGASDQSR
jgi:predicted Zn-dependent protease